jgi:ribulose-5-phosphate 4-epimerase/fuculose-1-phosphate aldolase
MSAISRAASGVDYGLLIARAVRILSALDLMDMNGHVSARGGAAGETMWINSRRASRSTLRGADVVPVDLPSGIPSGDGDPPPSEFHIHREIMLRRPDVGAVVHSHPEFVVTLSVVGHKLQPVTGIGSFLPEDVPMFDDASLVNTRDRGAAVADALGEEPAIVLRGHGVVVVGSSVEEAVARCVCAETNARIQYQAALLGELHVLRGAELQAVRAETWTPLITTKHWHHHNETARRNGAFEGME